MQKKIIDVFLRKAPKELILAIFNRGNKTYFLEIVRETKISVRHIHDLLKIMKKENLIYNIIDRRDNRIKYIGLTKKGIEIAKKVSSIKITLNH